MRHVTIGAIGFATILVATSVEVAADDLQQPARASQELFVARDHVELPATRFIPDRPHARGSFLPLLYGSLVGLEAIDGYSTLRGVTHGAQEANPLMRGAVRNPAAFWIVKGGVAAFSIAVSERVWRHHRGRAVATMLVTNGVMAAVAARNVAVLRGEIGREPRSLR